MVKILSVNARGLSNKEKRKSVFEYNRKNAEILIVQETHSDPNCEQIWANEWGGKCIFSHGTTASKGVAMFCTKNIFNKISNVYIDNQGRIIIIDLVENDQVITIAAIYAPNKDSPTFFKELQALLIGRSEHKIIIGDFNLTLDVEKDRLNTYANNNNAKNTSRRYDGGTVFEGYLEESK